MDPPSASTSASVPPTTVKEVKNRSITDIIGESFAEFDHRGKIVEPFDEESKRDAEFQEKLSLMLIDLLLEFHAWSSARPVAENDKTADKLEKDINGLMQTEKEQGMFQPQSFIGTPMS
ncbi:hypothetical protein C8Q75DRAFT_752540 [Abortiporus biennis]|nr:hypothetical protein C8Q75DRAFT_752540 [Abortiporus biennis]